MNKPSPHANLAAIDRHELVERTRIAQAALGDHAGARFEKFTRIQGGAIYELGTKEALERAFIRFEWGEVDQLLDSMFALLFNRGATAHGTVRSLHRDVRAIIREKRRRFTAKLIGVLLREVGKIARLLFLAALFVAISEFTSEACLYYLH